MIPPYGPVHLQCRECFHYLFRLKWRAKLSHVKTKWSKQFHFVQLLLLQRGVLSSCFSARQRRWTPTDECCAVLHCVRRLYLDIQIWRRHSSVTPYSGLQTNNWAGQLFSDFVFKLMTSGWYDRSLNCVPCVKIFQKMFLKLFNIISRFIKWVDISTNLNKSESESLLLLTELDWKYRTHNLLLAHPHS